MKKNFRLIKVLSIFILICLSACESTPKQGNSAENSKSQLKMNSAIKTGTLDNGMTYYVKQNSDPTNRITLRLVVKAGSAMEEDDQKGVAHFVEHLAFNGTKNFAKSSIVDYFEKIGMSFGPEVNAYTSFEETVYMLEIPADDIQMLRTSLLVLHDWACEISFDQDEINKERGVVTEEWRLSQGLNRRITEKQVPFLMKNSQFEKRLPIGDMNIISKVSRKRIIDFYKKWYRPEFMSIVAVGDIKADVLENEINKIMSLIPASKDTVEHPEFELPVQTKKNICVLKDPEQKYTIMNIFLRRENLKPIKTIEDEKEILALQIASLCFNQRLAEITNTPSSKWLDAGVGEYRATNNNSFLYLGLIPKEGMFEESFKAFLDEYDRMYKYGISEEELERAKKTLMVQLELILKNKDKIKSENIASNIVNYILTGNIPLSVEDEYSISKKLINNLNKKQVDEYTRNNFSNRGTLMFMVAPEKAKDIPSEKKLYDIWENYGNAEIASYSEAKTSDRLIDEPKGKGSIVSKKELKEIGGYEYVLNNGIKIITKKTSFEKDFVYIQAVSIGGKGNISDKDIPSSSVAFDYAIYSGFDKMSFNDVQKFLSTKKVTCNVNIYGLTERIETKTTNTDMEYAFQLTNMLFTQQHFTDDGWQQVIQAEKMRAEAYGSTPSDVLDKKVREILYPGDIRYACFDMAYFNKINKESAEKVYRKRFGNPGDFTFYIIGDFKEKQLLDYCCKYLGTLETTDDYEQKVYHEIPFPKGKKEAVVYKGQDNQGVVYMAFGGTIPDEKDVKKAAYDEIMLSELQSLLEIRLREVIREEKGGSYGVNVYSVMGTNGKEREYMIDITFGCKPNRQEELKNEVLKEIKKLQTQEVEEIYVEKLSENYKRTMEINRINNNWILDKMVDAYTLESAPKDFYISKDKEITDNITASELKKLANKYLDTQNYVCVFLKPESAK